MTASMAAGCGSSSSTADSKAADTTAAGESTEEKKEEGASDGKKTLSISVWDNDATPQFTAVAEGNSGIRYLQYPFHATKPCDC